MLGKMPVRKYLNWLLASAKKHQKNNIIVPTHNVYDLMSLATDLKFEEGKSMVNMHFALDDITADVNFKIQYKKSGTYFRFRLLNIAVGENMLTLGASENNKNVASKWIDKADSHNIRVAMPEFCHHVMPDLPYSSRDMQVCLTLSNMYYNAENRAHLVR